MMEVPFHQIKFCGKESHKLQRQRFLKAVEAIGVLRNTNSQISTRREF